MSIITAEMIEQQIRDILVSFLVKQSKENQVSIKDVQLRFLPIVNDEDISSGYQLLLDYKPFKNISFIDVCGVWKMAFQGLIEGYILQLYGIINEKECIDYKDIRIIIQATKDKPSNDDLIAYLYSGNKIVRKLEVSEFVGGDSDEAEINDSENNEINSNETNEVAE